jgi:hypothetical protein
VHLSPHEQERLLLSSAAELGLTAELGPGGALIHRARASRRSGEVPGRWAGIVRVSA